MLIGKGPLLLKAGTIDKEFNDHLSEVLDSHELSEFPSNSYCIKIQILSSILEIKRYINVKKNVSLVP